MSDEPLVVERVFDVDQKALFDAWTDPSIVARWFAVDPSWKTEMENDLRVGGRYQLRMLTAEGETHEMTGEYLEIEPPRRLSFTWSSHVVSDSRVIIDFEPQGNGTLLRITHHLTADADVRGAHQAGWHGCLGGLERLVGS